MASRLAPLKYRDLVKRLRKHDPRFEVWENRAKGSERMLYHPDIGGRPQSFPLKCHGDSTEIRIGMLRAIMRRFQLPRDVMTS